MTSVFNVISSLYTLKRMLMKIIGIIKISTPQMKLKNEDAKI
jgi:hypothetical protein